VYQRRVQQGTEISFFFFFFFFVAAAKSIEANLLTEY
jgi:hypothetical protein